MCPKKTWEKARDEFVATGLTLKAIADKFSLPYSTVRARAKREDWPELRQARIQQDRDTRIARADEELGISQDDKVEERRRWLARSRRLAGVLDDMIEAMLDPQSSWRNPDSLLKVANAALRAQELAFRAMNIVNDGADSGQGYKPPVFEIAGQTAELGDFPERYTELGDASGD